MLAVKFHHLRALIHRPYLRLTIAQGAKIPQINFSGGADAQVIDKEKICILAAQQTARLLHDITDERSLVLDFPWWQMISCLLCAGSILAVASAMINSGILEIDLDSQALQEDTEICVKVFDSLSIYSHAACRARNMLRSLKHYCIRKQGMLILKRDGRNADSEIESSSFPSEAQPLSSTARDDISAEATSTGGFPDIAWDPAITEPVDGNLPLLCFDWDTWPVAFSDPVSISAQSIAGGSFVPTDTNSIADGAPPAPGEYGRSFDFLK